MTKLDRIYLLSQFQGAGLGFDLLTLNLKLAKNNDQSGIWLYTWVGNKKAIDFYSPMGFKIIDNHSFHVAQNHYNPNHQMLLNFESGEI